MMLVFVCRHAAAAIDFFNYVEWSRKPVSFDQIPRGKRSHLLCVVERR